MQLVVDNGNTSTKVAVFTDTGEIVVQYNWQRPTKKQYAALLQSYVLDAAIVCSVGAMAAELVEWLQQSIPFVILLDEHTPLPIKNAYATPQTLGYDRLAVAVGANAMHRNTPILIIDAGTAITYEFVSDDNTYIGGNIAPGVTMRLRALHDYTHKLPLLVPDLSTVDKGIVGDDTQSAMQLGILQGMVYEIEGYIAALKAQFPSLLIFLTGGDAFFFERRLKSSIFVSPNLLLSGLHCILQYNKCLQTEQ